MIEYMEFEHFDAEDLYQDLRTKAARVEDEPYFDYELIAIALAAQDIARSCAARAWKMAKELNGQHYHLRSRVEILEKELTQLRARIADDGLAMSCLTLGEYRTRLIEGAGHD